MCLTFKPKDNLLLDTLRLTSLYLVICEIKSLRLMLGLQYLHINENTSHMATAINNSCIIILETDFFNFVFIKQL